MELLISFLLGLVQGVTEFLPISSSAHLALFRKLFHLGPSEDFLFLSVLSHVGTLLVVVFTYWEDIKLLLTLRSPLIFPLFLATIPLLFFVPFYPMIKKSFTNFSLMGGGFILTGLILYLGDLREKERAPTKWDPFYIGLAQASALLPGISRSGATISCARWFGYKIDEAIKFSFLLAIPATLGSLVLEIFSLIEKPLFSIVPIYLFVIPLTSFLVGLLTIKFLNFLGRMKKLRYFAWYCLGVGIFTLFQA